MPRKVKDDASGSGVHAQTRVGDSVAVEVRGGGTTGFAWEPTEPLPSGVRIDTERSVGDPDVAIGGMGNELLKFSFSKPGTYDLNLGFTSPGGNEVIETRNFKFEVE